MEPQKPKTTAKDFFVHLAGMASLYWVVGALMNLLHRVINVTYPPVNQYGSYGYFASGSIAWPVASLIVVFPLFIFFSWLIYRDYSTHPEKLQLTVRKWLVFITLFVAGGILVGSLVTVIYKYLDGQELTISFLLKVLSWLVVSGSVFGYYLQDIRDKLNASARKRWLLIAMVIVAGSVILGFIVIGSPRTQRLINYDQQKINDLQNIQNQIIQYWQQKGALPNSLADLKDPLSYYSIPVDSQSGQPYVYRKTGERSFDICAEFNLEPRLESNKPGINNVYRYAGIESENWVYGAGSHCFSRTVDPERYPVFPKPLQPQ